MEALGVRPATAADRKVIAGILESSWGGTTVVVHAAVYDALELPAPRGRDGARVVEYGPFLPARMQALGLGEIGAEDRVFRWTGGSPGAWVIRAGLEQLREARTSRYTV
jgi:hypothetical protein